MKRKTHANRRRQLANPARKTNSSFCANAEEPTIWAQPPVNVQPGKRVAAWSVYRATKIGEPDDRFGLHFVGRDLSDSSGCVSSRILAFDPRTMFGTTLSGRVYQLSSLPAYCADAEYVLQNWAHFNKVVVKDATDEFFEMYGLTLEELKKVGR